MPEILSRFKDLLLGVDIEDEDDDYDEDDYEEVVYDTTRRERASDIQTIAPRASERSGGGSSYRGSGSASASSYSSSRSTSNVVDLHKRTQVHVNAPKNIEDARDVIDNTRTNVISVVNLEGVDSANAQRIADFLSGSVDALDATIRRLSYDMFIIAPYGVDISGQLQADINEELKSSGIPTMSWLAFK